MRCLPDSENGGSGGDPAAENRRPGAPLGPPRLRRLDVYQALVIMVDGLAAVVAVAVAGGPPAGALALLAAVVARNLLRRGYPQLAPSALDDVPELLVRGVVGAGIATVVGLPVYGSRLPGLLQDAGALVTAMLFTALAVVGRGIGYTLLRRWQARGRLVSPTLIVGAGPTGARIGWQLRQHPELGLVPVGFVDRRPPSQPELVPAPVLGDVTHLPKLIDKYGIDHVVVAFCRMRDADLVDLVRTCDRLGCEIFVLPRLFELGVGTSAADQICGLPLSRLPRPAFRCHAWRLKRILDVALALVALLLTLPLMAAIALALRLEIGPGVLFRQVRIGLDGRPFELVKFRTIAPGRCASSGWSRVDPSSVGRVGRFLRRSSLDELPQLWNVLCGHMSLVGPRPEQSRYVAHFAARYPGYAARLRVPAGVTGWAQVHGLRGDTSIEDRVCFDNFYVEHWSLGLDLKILIRTVASVFRMRGG